VQRVRVRIPSLLSPLSPPPFLSFLSLKRKRFEEEEERISASKPRTQLRAQRERELQRERERERERLYIYTRIASFIVTQTQDLQYVTVDRIRSTIGVCRVGVLFRNVRK